MRTMRRRVGGVQGGYLDPFTFGGLYRVVINDQGRFGRSFSGSSGAEFLGIRYLSVVGVVSSVFAGLLGSLAK